MAAPAHSPAAALAHLRLPFDPASFPQDLAPPTPALRFLFRLQAGLEPQWAPVGHSTNGFRAVVPITGGLITAHPTQRLRGIDALDGARVIKGGADFLRRTDDGVFWPTAHYALELRSGHYIYVHSQGSRTIAPTASDPSHPAPHEMLFRLRLTLESDDPDPEIQRACRAVVIAAAVRGPGAIEYDAYAVE